MSHFAHQPCCQPVLSVMTDKNVAANKRRLFDMFPICSIFSVLSAILLLGNVTYTVAEDTKVLEVGPADVLSTLSDLLKV